MAKKKSVGKGVAATVAVAAVAAAGAAGAYYLYGSSNAKEHRRKAAVWMSKARKEVEREAKKFKDVALNEKNYKTIVKGVSSRYKALKNVDPKDVAAFVSAVNEDWKKFRGDTSKVAKKATRVAKKVAKKVKKAAKKVGK